VVEVVELEVQCLLVVESSVLVAQFVLELPSVPLESFEEVQWSDQEELFELEQPFVDVR
jgi:hypothetical protein